MKNRKIFIILAIFVVIIFIVSFFILFINLLSTKPSPTPTPIPPPTPISFPFNLPKTDKVAIPLGQEPKPSQAPVVTPITTPSTSDDTKVVMTNFFKKAKVITPQGDAIIVDEQNRYQIAYQSQFNKFVISILSSPFDQVRKEAEQAFINALGINHDQACMLDLEITTPISINPDEAGVTYPLSNCGMGSEGAPSQ